MNIFNSLGIFFSLIIVVYFYSCEDANIYAAGGKPFVVLLLGILFFHIGLTLHKSLKRNLKIFIFINSLFLIACIIIFILLYINNTVDLFFLITSTLFVSILTINLFQEYKKHKKIE